jgi:uncharacterized protein YdaU (DUF1376 family)
VNELPAPLTAPECDCTDLDGFMLNVERLMASELVALSTHEVVGASLFLWCRAWKQRPAASLPDDDRVNAAFARLPIARFRKLKDEILRGFVKCSDGRLYHRVLSEEATGAYERKLAFQKRRAADAKRLKEWRQNKGETADETPIETPPETPSETRFVAEGQGQGLSSVPIGTALSAKDRLWRDGPSAVAALAGPSAKPEQFRSVIGGWVKAGNTPEQILEAIAKAQAEKAIDPIPYIVACLRKSAPRKGEFRTVPRHEARRILEAAGLGQEPDPSDKPAYRDWKQKRESHLRLQGIDPRSLMQ